MSITEKTIDINAHIEDLKCEISVNDGKTNAKISFSNLGYGDITAIKFNACGYNSFGDNVPVNGKEKFFLIIQDLQIGKNEVVTDLNVKLPNSDIRKLELEECQICYADGSVISYEGYDSLSFIIEEIDDEDYLNALHKLYNKNVKFKPQDLTQGWICACGRFNKHDKNICSLCEMNKTNTIKICSADNRNELLDEYRISEERDRKSREEEEKLIEKEQNKMTIRFCICIAIAMITCFLVACIIEMSKREVYSSDAAMRAAMQGTWTYYSEGYNSRNAMWQWVIEGDVAYRLYYSDDEKVDGIDITWNPKNGSFTIGRYTCVVQKGGRSFVQEGNVVYEKGGHLSSSKDSSRSSNGY